MAEVQGKQSGQKYEVKKKEKKKKTKNTTSVKLPSARKSIKRQRHMAQGKAEFEGLWGIITVVVVGALILFILFGGINQRKAWETMKEWGETIGQKVSEWINPDQVIFTDDGVYVDPDGDGNPGISEGSGGE